MTNGESISYEEFAVWWTTNASRCDSYVDKNNSGSFHRKQTLFVNIVLIALGIVVGLLSYISDEITTGMQNLQNFISDVQKCAIQTL